MTCDTVSDSLCAVRQVCTDTIHGLSYDSLTAALLKDSQNFYSSSFSNLMTLIAVAVAIISIPGFWNWRKAKVYKKKMEKEYGKIKEYIHDIGGNFLAIYMLNISDNHNSPIIKVNLIQMFFITAVKLELDFENIKSSIGTITNIIINIDFNDYLINERKSYLVHSVLLFEDFCYAKNRYKNEIYQLILALETKFGKNLVDEVRRIKKEDEEKVKSNKPKK